MSLLFFVVLPFPLTLLPVPRAIAVGILVAINIFLAVILALFTALVAIIFVLHIGHVAFIHWLLGHFNFHIPLAMLKKCQHSKDSDT